MGSCNQSNLLLMKVVPLLSYSRAWLEEEEEEEEMRMCTTSQRSIPEFSEVVVDSKSFTGRPAHVEMCPYRARHSLST